MAFISAHSWLSFWPIVDSFFLAFVVMPYLAHNWLIVSLLKKKKKKKKKKRSFSGSVFFPAGSECSLAGSKHISAQLQICRHCWWYR